MKCPHPAQKSLASRSRKSVAPCFATAWTVLLVSISLLVPAAPAATIRFTATNLVDTAPGQDLWQYQYSVSNLLPNSGQGFSIFFDRGLYRDLKSPPAATNEGWDLLSIQPDSILESNGFFDALALLTGASLANPFVLTFVWLGAGLPGSQPFTVYDAKFSTVDGGVTTPPRPEISIAPAQAGDGIQIDWTPATAVLEESSDLRTWTPVAAAVSPWTVSLTNPGGPRFFRLRTAP